MVNLTVWDRTLSVSDPSTLPAMMGAGLWLTVEHGVPTETPFPAVQFVDDSAV
jgi:hypothetical protein